MNHGSFLSSLRASSSLSAEYLNNGLLQVSEKIFGIRGTSLSSHPVGDDVPHQNDPIQCGSLRCVCGVWGSEICGFFCLCRAVPCRGVLWCAAEVEKEGEGGWVVAVSQNKPLPFENVVMLFCLSQLSKF